MTLDVTADATLSSLRGYDMLIDVRSPAEFEADHVPGAVNLPVLSNEERAEVGTIYVQKSRFMARRIGAAHVARNVARHLETALADKPGGFRPLVYCWRGGMRSNAMATILSQVGWRTTVLAGGYRVWRRNVIDRLYDGALAHRFVLLDGQTGAGKTAVLARLAGLGLQTLDLEALAEHRGSLFGALGRPQPAQKLFESRLLAALEALDPGQAVVAEAESSKIGDRMIPPALWARMAQASRIELVAEPADRARHIAYVYREAVADPAALAEALERLPVRVNPKRLQGWLGLADAGRFAELAEALMALHYDPAYDRARKKLDRRLVGRVRLDPSDPASLDAAASLAAEAVASLDAGPAGRDSEAC